MHPKVWGPPTWIFLHSVTFNYPDNPTDIDKEIHRSFFHSLENILPCQKCRNHYKKNIQNYPIKLNSRKELIQWLIDVHNMINKENGKPILSYDDVINEYKELYGGNIRSTDYSRKIFKKKDKLILVFIFLFFLLLIYATSKKNNCE